MQAAFSPSDVAMADALDRHPEATHKKEQEEDRTLSLRIQRNADWIKQQNKEGDF
jgi:hypothetical protein